MPAYKDFFRPAIEKELRNLAEKNHISFAEMAEILSKTEDSTKKKYYRLLARLQSQLEEENEI